MQDGLSDTSTPHWNLVGGYYDAGDQIKFAFLHAFAMTMLSWSVIEYSHKYEAIGELNHVKEIIRWGTDYILKTFNSSATNINFIYCQVGVGLNNSNTLDDHHCWMRPEDMDYPLPVTSCIVDSYLVADIPGWYCGPQYYSIRVLHNFATVQVDYILKSYEHELHCGLWHHRATSIPKDGKMYTCTNGYKWRNSPNPNPHVVTGAMVDGPDKFGRFHDIRQNYDYTEPTIAGSVGLITVLIALSNGDNGVGVGIDKNKIFSAIPPMFPTSPPLKDGGFCRL